VNETADLAAEHCSATCHTLGNRKLTTETSTNGAIALCRINIPECVK